MKVIKKRLTNHSFWLGNAALEENGSNVSEHATEVVQPSDSEIDQIGECASCASLCDSEKVRLVRRKKESKGEMKVVTAPERREPKPQMEM